MTKLSSTPVTKKAKVTQALLFEYSGEEEHVSKDPHTCADLFRGIAGPSIPLPPPEEMEKDNYQYVTQLMVKDGP